MYARVFFHICPRDTYYCPSEKPRHREIWHNVALQVRGIYTLYECLIYMRGRLHFMRYKKKKKKIPPHRTTFTRADRP